MYSPFLVRCPRSGGMLQAPVGPPPRPVPRTISRTKETTKERTKESRLHALLLADGESIVEWRCRTIAAGWCGCAVHLYRKTGVALLHSNGGLRMALKATESPRCPRKPATNPLSNDSFPSAPGVRTPTPLGAARYRPVWPLLGWTTSSRRFSRVR